jgi:tRNA-(ms[2]io[6]A)-hydroxylase
VLGLKLPTDPRWVNLAEKSLADILTDHAYCEQKAASTCISLIQSYPEKTQLVEQLAPIVSEEWSHFRMVLDKLREHNLQLGRQRPDIYVNRLIEFRKKGSRAEVLVDRLLMSALIEARSCERFRLLSEGMKQPEFQAFYRQFMISEAGHYRLFTDLAKLYASDERVKRRWEEWLEFEAEVMRELEVRGDRIH